MDILVIGDILNLNECRAKFGIAHQYKLSNSPSRDLLLTHNLIFDFTIDEAPGRIKLYAEKTKSVFFLNTYKKTLENMMSSCKEEIKSLLVGFSGMPTFLNRSVLELCLLSDKDQNSLHDICASLETDFVIVKDKVGLVTPRVICMIINEAYYTLEEGTATREDIDLAMKLGTNYPYGPFEWCDRIGIEHVHQLLQAVYKETSDERYKISKLLTHAFLNQIK